MKKKKNNTRMGISDRTFDLILVVICVVLLITFLYPMIYVLSSSFSSGVAVSSGKVFLWPVDFSLYGYQWVFKNPLIWSGYKNSIIYTIGGTIVQVVMTICLAYPLSRRDYQGKPFMQKFLTVSMMFGGGLIPTFIVVSSLGFFNNPWWMVLSGAVGIGNAIMMRTYFQSNVPYELLESAKMDGISDFGYLIKVVLPLSKAIISVIALYAVVGKWNSYMTPLLYLRSKEYWPLQMILNDMLNKTQMDQTQMSQADANLQEGLQASLDAVKYALIVVAVVPMLAIYPFVQKFFEKGVTMGSIKG